MRFMHRSTAHQARCVIGMKATALSLAGIIWATKVVAITRRQRACRRRYELRSPFGEDDRS